MTQSDARVAGQLVLLKIPKLHVLEHPTVTLGPASAGISNHIKLNHIYKSYP